MRDREEETRQKWASLQEKSCTWKSKIYEKFENAQKMEENLKVIKELCEKAEKESITPEEIDAGTVFVDEVNRKLNNSGTVPPGMIYFLSISINFALTFVVEPQVLAQFQKINRIRRHQQCN